MLAVSMQPAAQTAASGPCCASISARQVVHPLLPWWGRQELVNSVAQAAEHALGSWLSIVDVSSQLGVGHTAASGPVEARSSLTHVT